ncbi:class I SAM-dependent methyltransferase [Niallia sp. XMNu-256]|uniref:class I SAM-dependent DNA methyltransferase n=1 Tax=Niallia sp. XMNu-256 TaxID=3082444 RepID=UPI0030CE2945
MGKDFVDLFNQWAVTYDRTVAGFDLEYQEAFFRYDEILEEVANLCFGNVIEFGPGTGNLTKKLLAKQLFVIGVEPSSEMRKIAKGKLGKKVDFIEGDFFDFPQNIPIQTFASSYAFHHLTDIEKADAIALYSKILPVGGKIIFADTIFETREKHQEAITKALNNKYHHLAQDLQTEYYTTIPVLSSIMEKNQLDVTFTRFNDFVWIMEATKR